MRMYNRRHFPLGESISTWHLGVKNIRGEVAVVLSSLPFILLIFWRTWPACVLEVPISNNVCPLLLEVSYTGHFSDVPLRVWEWHRWHADLSSTWPCSETVVCWWCHSEWCSSSDWGLWWKASLWSPAKSLVVPMTSNSYNSTFPSLTEASLESPLCFPA